MKPDKKLENPFTKSVHGKIGKRNAEAKKLANMIIKEVGEDTVKRVQEFCEACERDMKEAHRNVQR